MLGARLKALRKAKNLTQKELAEEISVTHVSISGYENGNRTPDTETLQALADFFNVTTDYLLGRDEANTPKLTPKDERDIAKAMNKLKDQLKNDKSTDNEKNGLSFHGEPLSDEAIDSLLSALEFAERTAKVINKKYTPKKYRDKN